MYKRSRIVSGFVCFGLFVACQPVPKTSQPNQEGTTSTLSASPSVWRPCDTQINYGENVGDLPLNMDVVALRSYPSPTRNATAEDVQQMQINRRDLNQYANPVSIRERAVMQPVKAQSSLLDVNPGYIRSNSGVIDTGIGDPQIKSSGLIPIEKSNERSSNPTEVASSDQLEERTGTRQISSESVGVFERHTTQSPISLSDAVQPMIRGLPVDNQDRFPWMANLEISVTDGVSWLPAQSCGATLISDQWVMTAAHCVNIDGFFTGIDVPLDFLEIKVKIGSLSLDGPDMNIFMGKEAFCHSSYNSDTFENDIALIKLNAPIELTQYHNISVAKLPVHGTDTIDDELPTAAIVPTGWGKTEMGTTSVELLMIALTVDEATLRRNMFDAREGNGNQSLCFGDSGGPAHGDVDFRSAQTGTVVGIASNISGNSDQTQCALTGLTSSFTRVSAYRNDIDLALTTY